MKKVILVDGNNLLFRSYYATAYTGNIMKNSKGFPTNGLFGFVNMMNKIINEENPEFLLVAFDIGKTFRHEKYDNYKGGRSDTPDDLKRQFPVAKEILTAMNVKYLEVPSYEADDIIGTLARMIDESDEYEGLIVSSDKDLLQLISDKVQVKLLKTKDHIMMNKDTFKENYGIDPIRMIDLKGLMGDSSDNIPGVKGIGEKTAIKLLKEYDTIENLYKNLNNLKGATYNKLIEGEESAYQSKELATIYKEVPIDITFADIKFNNNPTPELINLFKELEFNNFLQKLDIKKAEEEVQVKIIKDTANLNIEENCAIYINTSEENYHKANILGIAIYNEKNNLYIPIESITNLDFIKEKIYTYDNKKNYVSLAKYNLSLNETIMDVMIACYLLNYNVKDDISIVANTLGYDIEPFNKKATLTLEEEAKLSIKKAKFIYEITDKLVSDMKHNGVIDLYKTIELPLSNVLAKMELNGIYCDSTILDDMGNEIKERVDGCNSKRIGVCLDTCHIHDGGYDLNDFDFILKEFDEMIGLEYLKVIHLNDSKNVCGAHKDRHENLGHGHIGFDNLCKIAHHESLKDIPIILETPYIDDKAPYKEEIEMIRNKTFRNIK